MSGGVLGLVWGLVRPPPAGELEVVAPRRGALLVAAFVAWELGRRRADAADALLRSRAFSAGQAAIFFARRTLFGGVFFLAQFMQIAHGYGPLQPVAVP